jgi:PIN like domain
MGKNVVAQKLRAAGYNVEIHAKYFREDERDEVWLDKVGRRRWIVISKDDAIRRREIERRALMKAKVRALFLTSCNTSGPENAEIILRAMSRIEKFVTPLRRPAIFLVHANGSLVRNL